MPGINYYRLLQTDIDGWETYSQIVPVTLNTPPGKLFVYPNPVFTGWKSGRISAIPLDDSLCNKPLFTFKLQPFHMTIFYLLLFGLMAITFAVGWKEDLPKG